jgi:nicotinate-nucleotide pyrophosphorylase (carboxylating)
MQLDTPFTRRLINLALEEDLGFGDITSELTISEKSRGTGTIRAKQPCVVCGLPIVPLIFRELGWEAEIKILKGEGSWVSSGTALVSLDGSTRHLLSAERTILNFLQRLSGVATYTKRVVDAAGGLQVLDTRKTMPGGRVLDKYAVSVGGGKNHRYSLGDMVLIKNNHVDSVKSLDSLLSAVREKKPPYMPIEVEVRTLGELRTALKHRPTIVMLDNMSDGDIKKAVAVVRKEAPDVLLEVSGGVTIDRLKSLKGLGVDCVSMGALTTQATNVDISMAVSSKG